MNLNCHKSVSNITKFSCKETVILLSRPFCNLHTHILRSVLGYILVQHLVNVCTVDLKFSLVNCKSQGYGKMMLKGSEDNIAFSFNYCFDLRSLPAEYFIVFIKDSSLPMLMWE